jgi:hypothetical protein
MITLEQLKALKIGDYIYQTSQYTNPIPKLNGNGQLVNCYQDIEPCKPVRWRINGQLKLWQRTPSRFKLPIKFGLYQYSYITEENAHLFTLEYTK